MLPSPALADRCPPRLPRTQLIGAPEAVALGILEGVTEFLPVSSTGHLIVASNLLGSRDPTGTFEVVVQLGAVLAVAWYYRRDLRARLAAIPSSGDARRFWANLLLAFLPAGALGLALGDWVTARLFSPTVVAVGLIAGGVALWLVERTAAPAGARGAPSAGGSCRDAAGSATRGLDAVTATQALVVGFAQTLALVPGVSRSGASIVGGLLAGLDRGTAAAFSFHLALPTLGGAVSLKLVRDAASVAARGDGLELAAGTVAAFVTALATVGWLLRFVSRHGFRAFAVYRVLAGLAILSWLALR